MIEIPAEKSIDATRLLKNPKIPKGIKILNNLALFGKPDAIIIFESENEELAAEFVIQFRNLTNSTTLVALPFNLMKWTR